MKMTILVGVPMSGKSTLAKKIVDKNIGTVILDCDMIRKMLTGESDKHKAFNINNEILVWGMFERSLNLILEEEKDVVVANTNCNLVNFKNLILKARIYNYDVEVVFLVTPIEICIERLPENSEHMIGIIEAMEVGKVRIHEFAKENEIKFKTEFGYCYS